MTIFVVSNLRVAAPPLRRVRPFDFAHGTSAPPILNTEHWQLAEKLLPKQKIRAIRVIRSSISFALPPRQRLHLLCRQGPLPDHHLIQDTVKLLIRPRFRDIVTTDREEFDRAQRMRGLLLCRG